MLTSCWSRDISKRGLIKLPPCGGRGAVRGVGEDSDAIGGSARDDKTESTRSRCAPRLYRPQGLQADPSRPEATDRGSPLLNFNKPISNTLQLPGHVESSGERKGVSMTVEGEGLGRWRYWELLGECSFFLTVDNYFVIRKTGVPFWLVSAIVSRLMSWFFSILSRRLVLWYLYIIFFVSHVYIYISCSSFCRAIIFIKFKLEYLLN